MTKTKRKTAGIVGVLAGFLGLLAFLVGPGISEALYPKPPIEDVIADKALKIRDTVVSRLKGQPSKSVPLSRRFDTDQLPYTLSLALAGVAIIAGCTGYLRREDRRFTYVACGAGTMTLALNVLLLALGALIICAILFVVASIFFDAGG